MTTPMLEAFGWTLLHFLWQGTLIALVLAAALWLLRNASPQTRYVLCCAAMVLSLVVVVITWRRMLGGELSVAPADGRIQVPGQVVGLTAWGSGQVMLAALEAWVPRLPVLWAAGLCCFLLRLGLGIAAAMQLSSTALSYPDEPLLPALRRIAVQLGVHRPVRLLRSARVQVPVVTGWLRPAVLLPVSALAGLSPEQVEVILAHELAHIRRHDYLVNILQSVMEALLFFHPATWWISRQIRQQRELCCDDMAASLTGDRAAYARALYLLAERRFHAPAVTLSSNGGFLTMRIQRLLKPAHNPQGAAAMPALALLLIAAAALIGTAKAELKAHTPARPALAALLHTSAAPVETLPVSAAHPLLASVALPEPPAMPANAYAGSEEEKRRQVPSGVMAGNIRSKVNPIYPPEARAAHIEGSVIMKAIIGTTGDITNLQVVSGPAELMKSAVTAVSQWKYAPYLLNGQPTEVETTITVNYTLGN